MFNTFCNILSCNLTPWIPPSCFSSSGQNSTQKTTKLTQKTLEAFNPESNHPPVEDPSESEPSSETPLLSSETPVPSQASSLERIINFTSSCTTSTTPPNPKPLENTSSSIHVQLQLVHMTTTYIGNTNIFF